MSGDRKRDSCTKLETYSFTVAEPVAGAARGADGDIVRVLCCSCSRAFLKIEEVFQVLGQRSPPPGSAAIDLGAPLTKPYKSTLCASSCSQCVHTACSASTDIHVLLQLADFSAGHPFCAMTRTVLRLCRRCARRLDGLPRAPGLPGAGGRPRRPGPGSGGAEQRCELSLHHYYSSPVSKLLLGAGHVPGVRTHPSP